ncbi:MAG: hypothetical protein RR256_04410, partial [Bacteroidales bacterium]
LKLPNISLPKITTPSIPYFKLDTTVSATYKDTMTFSLANNIEIDRVLLDSFDLNFNIGSTFDMTVIISFKINNIVDSKGLPFQLNDTLTRTQTHNKRYSLHDYSIVFDRLIPGVPISVLEMEFTTTLDFKTATNTFPNVKNGDLTLGLAVNNLSYKKVQGYFGKLPLSFHDTISVPGLENQQVNGFQFNNANLILEITNGASMPVRLEQSSVEAFYKQTSPVKIDMLPDNYDLPYPAPTDQPMEKISTTNTSIDDLIINFPTAFGYSMQGFSNPDENKAIRNVIDKNSSIGLNMYVDVPLDFSVDNFVMKDTFPLSLATIEPYLDLLELFELKMIITNAFPIDAILSLAFLDKNTDTLFTMAVDQLIHGGEVNAKTGHVVKPTLSFLSQVLHKDQIPLLRDVKYIGVHAKMSTTDKKKVKIYQDTGKEGFLAIKIGTRLKIQAGSLLNSQK